MSNIQIILNLGWWKDLDIVGFTYESENRKRGYWWCRFLMFEIFIHDKKELNK